MYTLILRDEHGHQEIAQLHDHREAVAAVMHDVLETLGNEEPSKWERCPECGDLFEDILDFVIIHNGETIAACRECAQELI